MRRYPHQLSGGMLQRCVIAMALMTNPSLLIMDEPTTALDVTTQAVVLDLVAELKREFDSAILYITHDLGVITKICDRVGVMYAGEFMEQADAARASSSARCTPTRSTCWAACRTSRRRRRSARSSPSRARSRASTSCRRAASSRRAAATCEDACRVKQPPLIEVEDACNSRACRRWQVVPPPAEHIRAATEALAPVAAQSARPRTRSSHVDDLKVHFKSSRGFSAPRPAAHPRRRRRRPRRVRRPDARRRGRERLRQDDRGARHHRPHARAPAARSASRASRSSRAPASARGRRCARSRWSSRTRTRRSTPRAAWATRSAAR